jgi:hypothetical protein
MKSGCKPFKILQHAAAVLFGCIVRQHAAGSYSAYIAALLEIAHAAVR